MNTSAADPVVIVDGARTPMGGFQGDLAAVKAPALGATAITGALERAGMKPDDIEEIVMGCVQAPARQASLGAGIPEASGCTTINKMCGSGMKAVMFAHDQLLAGSAATMIAGGLESMSNAPYLLPKVRDGLRMGHGEVKDHMFLDGLEDAYDPGKLMGHFAEKTATRYQFTREAQDEFAITSLKRAQAAMDSGAFTTEIKAVNVKTRKGEHEVELDEQPPKANFKRIPTLRPAFDKDGTVTAANASSISDGAAALVMMRMSEAEKRGLTPRAKILAHSSHAHAPMRMRPNGLPPRQSMHLKNSLQKLARKHPILIFTKSTKHLQWSQWLQCMNMVFLMKRSTSMAAHVRLDTQSVLQALA